MLWGYMKEYEIFLFQRKNTIESKIIWMPKSDYSSKNGKHKLLPHDMVCPLSQH